MTPLLKWLHDWWGVVYLSVGVGGYLYGIWVLARRQRAKRLARESTLEVGDTIGILIGGLLVMPWGWPLVAAIFGAFELFKHWMKVPPPKAEKEAPPVSDSATYRKQA